MPYFTVLNIVNDQHYRVVTLTSLDFLTGRARTDNNTGSQVWLLSPYQVVCPVCPVCPVTGNFQTNISSNINASFLPPSLPPCPQSDRSLDRTEQRKIVTENFSSLVGFLILKIVRNLNIIITLSSVLSRIYKIRNKNYCKKFNARKLQALKNYLAALTSPSEAKFV